MSMICALIKKRRQFVLYMCVGCSGAAIDFLVFWLLKQHLYYLYANLISVTLGITNNFFLNNFFIFKTRTHIFRRFITFFTIGLCGMGLSTFILWISVELLKMPSGVGKAVVMVIVPIFQYMLNRRITFKNAKEE